jgi:hypothetical protein
MFQWAKPQKRIKPGWWYRILFLAVATWLFAYLMSPPAVRSVLFSRFALLEMGAMVLSWLAFMVILTFADPIRRKEWWKRFQRRTNPK